MKEKLEIVLFTYGLPFTGDTLDHQALGGAETAFIYVGKELAKLGHDVIAFCPCSNEGSYDGVEYRHYNKFDNWRDNSGCDLFICSRFYQIFEQPINAKVCALWLHDHLTSANIPDLLKVISKIDYIYCLSQYHREYIGSLIPEHISKIHVTHNGVDLELINTIRTKTKTKRHKMMYIARPERGLAEALHIYRQLEDKNLEFLACSYPYPNEEVGGSFAPLAQQLNQEGYKVSFGQFNKKELYTHIAESEVVIYPSNTPEVFCIGAVEAQSCGTVFLARELGALSETVGYPCQKGQDPSGFLNATRHVLQNKEFRQIIEQMGLQHAEQFTWDLVAKQFGKEAITYIKTKANSKSKSKPQTKLASKSKPKTKAITPKSLDNKKKVVSTPISNLTLDNDKLPKISCLTVTKDRILLFKESVQCFLQQKYPNKELIVVAMGEGHYRNALTSYIESLNNKSIKLKWVDGEDYNLGKARNLSLELATGEIICIWDDDDLYHPDRLVRQYLHMTEQKAEGCCLTEFLQFFQKDSSMYWVDWNFEKNLKGHDSMLPGSLMAYKKSYFQYPETGEKAHIAEDNYLMDNIAKRMKIVGLEDSGYLYVYRYHSRNVHSEQHHRQVGAYGCQTMEYLKNHAPQIMDALRTYPLPSPVKLLSREGSVFINHLH